MARVAVVHNTLDFQGGADAVALSVCDSLTEAHDVDLVTVSNTVPAELAGTFGLDVSFQSGRTTDDTAAVTVRMPPGGKHLAGLLARSTTRFGPQLALRSSLVAGYYRRIADEYDLAISTTNELAIPGPSIQYVHFPQYNLDRLPERFDVDSPGQDAVGEVGFHHLRGLIDEWLGPEHDDFDQFDGRDGVADFDNSASVRFLANSTWTADAVESIYGHRPRVVYPPVAVIDGGPPLSERECGVVVVGRIAPDCRVLDAIEIVDRVRNRGHDLHLHLIGTAPSVYSDYVARVRDAVTDREFVTLETDVSRDRLESRLLGHRYGLNVRPDESFGIAVAEAVSAGMVVFAPDSGGQREILDHRPDRLFGDVDEAVDMFCATLERDVSMVEASLSPVRDRFGSDRFRRAIREEVTAVLATR